jgi:hypothetical protein
MKRFTVAVCVLILMGAAPSDYQGLLARLHITSVRAGADGMNPNAPNAANYDESRTATYSLPDPLRLANGNAVTTADGWWKKRRPQIAVQFESEVYGRIPAQVPGVTWQVTGGSVRPDGAVTEHLVGHVDNRADPALKVDIAVDLTLPRSAKPVPVMIVLTWTGKWANLPIPPGQGPDWKEQLLAAGWGYAEYVPTSVQADDPAKLREGIIGLVNKGTARSPEQWGALRAWGWGVSRVVDVLSTDARVDARRIGVGGHSRYGKAALVAMAFDPRLAVGYISSSGAGGAKLLRRDYGERLENLAGEGEHHWMAGNFVAYGGPKTVADLPVDAHELIALCAPRPVFIGSGTREAGDGWTDPRGMFLAAVAAGPVYRLLGAGDLGTDTFPPVGTEVTKGTLAFRQHPFGHTMQPNWAPFIAFAKERLK